MKSLDHAIDPFLLNRLTPRDTVGRTVMIFRSFYLQALAVFLLVHFPLRIIGHFLRSEETVGAVVGSVAARAVVANALLLVSWTLVEGALLAILVQKRRGVDVGMGSALNMSLCKLPVFLASRTLFLLGTVAGLALLIVPGVLFACLFMLHGWLIFDRDMGPIAAMRTSAGIVRSRLRTTIGLSAPVAAMNLLWVAVGVVLVALTIQATAPIMPIFKIAPFTMTLMETGFIFFTILTGIIYVNTPRARAKQT